MTLSRACLLPPLLLLASCGTTTVFDDWTCDTPTGSCTTIAEVDASAMERSTAAIGGFPPPPSKNVEQAESVSPPTALSATSSSTVETPMPTRTPDVTARIVFAPFTDASGVFHGRAVVHAVMEDGEWIAPPTKTGGASDAR